MTKPFSTDVRKRMLAAVEAGASRHAVAERFAVSANVVIKRMQRHRAEGTIEPLKVGGDLRRLLEPHDDRIRALVAVTPDIAIDEPRRARRGRHRDQLVAARSHPIESVFVKIKAVLRKRAERSVDSLRTAVGDAIRTVTREDCAN